MKFYIIFTIVYLLAAVLSFMYYTLVFSYTRKNIFRFPFIILSLNVLIARILPENLPIWLLQAEAYLSGLWMGILYYSVLAVIFHGILYLIFRCFRTVLPKEKAAAVILSIFSAVIIWGSHRAFHPVIRTETITTDKLMPGSSCHIVLTSDWHLGKLLNKNFASYAVDLINSTSPDAVIIAGDLIDEKINPVLSGNALNPLKNLKTQEGIYFALGNHDYIDDSKKLCSILEKENIHVLHNRSINIMNNTIKITGIADFSRDRSNKALKELSRDNKNYYSILIDHQPRRMSEAAKASYDLYLAGHTHTGQMWPNRIFTKKIFDTDYGRAEKDGITVIVSSGLGFWGPPIRSSAAPEIILINLTGKTAEN